MIKRKKSAITLEEASRPPKDYDICQDGITQSLCANFLCCPLRGMLTINRWSDPAKAMSTRFGSMFHDCLDAVYTNGISDVKKIEKLLNSYIDEHAAEWGADGKAELDAALASALFEVYIKHWKSDFSSKKFRSVERTAEAQFHEYKLRCKIDGEFSGKNAGSVWLMEHKTKSRIEEETLLQKITFDFQNLFYRNIYQIEHPKVRLSGTLYNIIRKPGHKMKGGETLKQFRNRLVVEIKKDPEHFFKRYQLAYTPQDDERFTRELLQKLKWIQNLINGNVPAWRNEFACETPYRCEFLAACSTGTMTGYVRRKALMEELNDVREII